MTFRERYEQDFQHIEDRRGWIILAITLAVFFAVPLILNDYIFDITLFLIYGMVALSLALLVGFTGQVSLGHAGFFAAGAYTMGFFMMNWQWPFFLALIMAVIVPALLGLIIGIPALRLEGPYLAIATLGFGIAIQQILNNWNAVGASSGMLVDRPFAWLGAVDFYDDAPFYYLVLVIALLVTWLCFNLKRSHIGRAFMAVREAEKAAQMCGINLSYYKVLAFVISAGFTGLAGGLYAHWLGYLSPEGFNLLLSIKFLLMVVVGGLGFLPGAILGTALILGVELWFARAGSLFQLIFGIIVILLMMLEPLGLYGRWLKIKNYWRSWPM